MDKWRGQNHVRTLGGGNKAGAEGRPRWAEGGGPDQWVWSPERASANTGLCGFTSTNQSQLPHRQTFRLRTAFLVPTTAGDTPYTHLWALSSFLHAERQALFSTPVIRSGYRVLGTRSQKICFHLASWYPGGLPGSLGGPVLPLQHVTEPESQALGISRLTDETGHPAENRSLR